MSGEFLSGDLDEDDPFTILYRALYRHKVQVVRAEASQLDVQPARLKKVFTAARLEADRSSAILMFALAEDLMLSAIERYCCTNLPGNGWKDAIAGNGLLATANNRLTFLFLLGWMDPSVHADLHLMKSIRNRFAHHADVEGFNDPKIRGYISTMTALEQAVFEGKAKSGMTPPKKLTPRQLFLMRSALTIAVLVTTLSVAPRARITGVAPWHVVDGDWKLLPDNLKAVHRLAVGYTVEVVGAAEPEQCEASSGCVSTNLEPGA
jgi:hypothetical protein